MMFLTKNNGKTIYCDTWQDVINNLTIHVSPGDFEQAKSMMQGKHGCKQWYFVNGFKTDILYKRESLNGNSNK
tara:strand:+ start:258 stop:476 length:219 start_codon:yes stop_codon:yes gene_type:complete